MKNIEKCSVYLNGEIDAWNNLEKIKELHAYRHRIYEDMRQTEDTLILHDLFKAILSIEKRLQTLWGFDQNPNFIKFWKVPQCSCPVYDNEDNYPHGPYVYNMDCKVHSK